MSKNFHHTIYINRFMGSHYDVGKQKGVLVRERHGRGYIDSRIEAMRHSPLYRHLGLLLNQDNTKDIVQRVEDVLKSVHPELLDEIQGFADGLNEPYEKIFLFTTASGGTGKGCSHFVLNGYHAHNYDDSPKNLDSQLSLLSVEGEYAHVGFSNRFIGRLDGMNEKGVCVSLGFGGGSVASQVGIGGTIFERIVLDKTSSVKEAKELLKEVQYVSPSILLISDQLGDIIAIEMDGDTYRVHEGTEAMACFNHYSHPEMKREQKITNPTTHWREQKFNERRDTLTSKEDIFNFLIEDFPNGLYEPYYDDDLGTMWSVVFNPRELGIGISVGERNQNRHVHFLLKEQLKNFTLPEELSVELKSIELESRLDGYKI